MESWPLVAGMHQNVETATAVYQPRVNLADPRSGLHQSTRYTKHPSHLELLSWAKSKHKCRRRSKPSFISYLIEESPCVRRQFLDCCCYPLSSFTSSSCNTENFLSFLDISTASLNNTPSRYILVVAAARLPHQQR